MEIHLLSHELATTPRRCAWVQGASVNWAKAAGQLGMKGALCWLPDPGLSRFPHG